MVVCGSMRALGKAHLKFHGVSVYVGFTLYKFYTHVTLHGMTLLDLYQGLNTMSLYH